MTMRSSFTCLLTLTLTLPALGSPQPRDGGSALIVTPTKRLEGSLDFESGSVRVTARDGQSVTVPHSEIIRLSTGRRALRVRGPQALRLRSGEIWQATILSLQGRKLSISSSLFGDHTVPLEEVATLDFAPDLPSNLDVKSGWLYREAGEPTPGELLWIDGSRLAIDSPLGVLTLPREGLSRYVLPSSQPQQDDVSVGEPDRVDEVQLADGSLYRGRLTLSEEGVLLEHEVFGEIRLPSDVVQEIERHHPGMIDLVDSVPASLQQQPLTSGPARAAGLRRLRGVETGASTSPRFVKALRIEAHTTVRYPPTESGVRTLRTLIQSPAEGRGEAVVRIGTAKSTLLETRIQPQAGPERVDLRFQADDEIVIEVDFGNRIRFPCAIVLADPLLIRER